MQQYIVTKIIEAEPQEIDGRQGYKVRYPDGYTSWSPAGAFEEAYRRADGMPFGLAIEALKKGKRVARAGWNGKGMWLSLSGTAAQGPHAAPREVPAEAFWSANNRAYAEAHGGAAVVLPCITMKTADGSILMGWLASQTDMLADDWLIVE